MPRSLRVLGAAAVAALALSAVTVPAAAVPSARARAGWAQAAPAPAGSRILLASQTAWVAPGQELVLRLGVTTDRAPQDVEVAVAVYRRLTGRIEFSRTLEGRPRGAALVVASTPLSELAADPAGAVVVRLPVQDPAQPSEGPQLRLRDEGVYPVRVELRQIGGGDTLADLGTHLVYATTPEAGGHRLGAALVLPVHAPPAVSPDGTRRLAPAGTDPLAALARSLQSHPGTQLTLNPTPETLDALAASPREADRETLSGLVSGVSERQVVTAPYVPVDLPAFVAAGLEGEAAAQVERGRQTIDRTLQVRADPRTWVTRGRLDEATVGQLRRQQVDRIVLPEAALVPVESPVTLAQPFELEARAVRRPLVLAADPGMAAHFTGQADPVLAAHRLLAELAVVYFDRPGHVRSVVAMPPREWRPDQQFLDTLLDGLSSSPILYGSTLDDAFTNVPLASLEPGHPVVRRLAPAPAGSSALPAAALVDARRRLESFATMLEPDNPLDDAIEQLLLLAATEGLRPRQRSAYLRAVDERISAETGLVRVPENRSITLTGRTGIDIPVTILSRARYPVRLRVQVSSDKLVFPSGADRGIELARRNTTERFEVQARTSGAFPLRVNLVSPDGGLLVGQSQFTVRSTAASGVGVVLSAGAGGFLVVWWVRHRARARRNRRLVPA